MAPFADVCNGFVLRRRCVPTVPGVCQWRGRAPVVTTYSTCSQCGPEQQPHPLIPRQNQKMGRVRVRARICMSDTCKSCLELYGPIPLQSKETEVHMSFPFVNRILPYLRRKHLIHTSIILIFSILVAPRADSQNDSLPSTTGEFYKIVSVQQDKKLKGWEVAHYSYVMGVLNGTFTTLYYSNNVCKTGQSAVGNNALRRAFLNWAKNNPGEWSQPGQLGAIKSMLVAWPCEH